MIKLTIYTFAAGILIVIFSNLFIDEKTYHDPIEKFNKLSKIGKTIEADSFLFEEIKNNPGNLDLHYHFLINKSQKTDSSIINYYNLLSKSDSKTYSDIGKYACGLIFSIQNKTDTALIFWQKIENKNLKYLNNSTGWCLMQQQQYELAETYFRKEIFLSGNIASAYNNLNALYKKTDSKEKIRELYNSQGEHLINETDRRKFFFLEGNLKGYFNAITDDCLKSTNAYGFVAAIFILLIWVIYLWKIDMYEKEKWFFILLTVFLGALFAQLTFLLHDFNEFILGNSLNGNIINDFLYSIFGIGVIEELIKLLPLLLFITFTNHINEPIDFIKYASLSAAGFAFSENLIYFDEDALNIIPGRALMCVTSHMFYSSLVAYGFVLSKEHNHKYKLLTVVVFFLTAAFIHGMYDFWLINDTVNAFSKLSLVLFLFTTFGWMMIVNNCLSNSPFFDEKKIITSAKLRDYLFSGLISVFILQFILITIHEGPSEGNLALLNESTFGIIILPFVVSSMTNVKILKNYWYHKLHPSRNIRFEEIIGKKFELTIREKNEVINGVINKRIVFKNDPNWFEIELFNRSYSDEIEQFIILPKTSTKHILKNRATTIHYKISYKTTPNLQSDSEKLLIEGKGFIKIHQN